MISVSQLETRVRRLEQQLGSRHPQVGHLPCQSFLVLSILIAFCLIPSPFGLFALKGWRALSLGCQCCLHCCRFATSNRTKRISNCTGITAPSHALFCPAPWSVMQLQDALVPLFVCVVSKSSDFLTSLPHKLDKSAMSLTVYCHGSFQ